MSWAQLPAEIRERILDHVFAPRLEACDHPSQYGPVSQWTLWSGRHDSRHDSGQPCRPRVPQHCRNSKLALVDRTWASMVGRRTWRHVNLRMADPRALRLFLLYILPHHLDHVRELTLGPPHLHQLAKLTSPLMTWPRTFVPEPVEPWYTESGCDMYEGVSELQRRYTHTIHRRGRLEPAGQVAYLEQQLEIHTSTVMSHNLQVAILAALPDVQVLNIACQHEYADVGDQDLWAEALCSADDISADSMYHAARLGGTRRQIIDVLSPRHRQSITTVRLQHLEATLAEVFGPRSRYHMDAFAIRAQSQSVKMLATLIAGLPNLRHLGVADLRYRDSHAKSDEREALTGSASAFKALEEALRCRTRIDRLELEHCDDEWGPLNAWAATELVFVVHAGRYAEHRVGIHDKHAETLQSYSLHATRHHPPDSKGESEALCLPSLRHLSLHVDGASEHLRRYLQVFQHTPALETLALAADNAHRAASRLVEVIRARGNALAIAVTERRGATETIDVSELSAAFASLGLAVDTSTRFLPRHRWPGTLVVYGLSACQLEALAADLGGGNTALVLVDDELIASTRPINATRDSGHPRHLSDDEKNERSPKLDGARYDAAYELRESLERRHGLLEQRYNVKWHCYVKPT